MQYDKHKNISFISDPTPIKPLHEVTKVLHSQISTSIKKGDCYDAWKIFFSPLQKWDLSD